MYVFIFWLRSTITCLFLPTKWPRRNPFRGSVPCGLQGRLPQRSPTLLTWPASPKRSARCATPSPPRRDSFQYLPSSTTQNYVVIFTFFGVLQAVSCLWRTPGFWARTASGGHRRAVHKEYFCRGNQCRVRTSTCSSLECSAQKRARQRTLSSPFPTLCYAYLSICVITSLHTKGLQLYV